MRYTSPMDVPPDRLDPLAQPEHADAVAPLCQALDDGMNALGLPLAAAEPAPGQEAAWAVAVVQERSEASQGVVAIARALAALGDPAAAASVERGVRAECHDVPARNACWAALRALRPEVTGTREVVARTAPRAHQREAPEAWVYRLVERPDWPGAITLTRLGERLVAVETDREHPVPPQWDPRRERALAAWLRARSAPPSVGPRPGAVFAVVDGPGAWTRVLLTRKGADHPVAALRGRLTFPGGSLEGDETPLDGLLRELFEEVRSPSLAGELASHARHFARFELPIVRHRTTARYALDVFVVRAPNAPTFARWMGAIDAPLGLVEAAPAILTRGEAEALLGDPAAFGAGHDAPLRALLGEVPAGS